MLNKFTQLIKPSAVPDQPDAISLDYKHLVLGTDMRDVPTHCEQIWLAMGCFWGAERRFWQLDGVYSTAVGYAGGTTKHPRYEQVCSRLTGHTEVVQVVFDPAVLSLEALLKTFWEAHDPTQGMRQGNDRGTQYRSAIYGNGALIARAIDSAKRYQLALAKLGFGAITTEIGETVPFYYAEQYHQQYLNKNPNGYCGLKGTGAECPI